MLGALHFYLKSKTSVFQNCANCTFSIKKHIHSCPSLNSRIQTKCIFSVKIFLLTSFLFCTLNWCLEGELIGWKSKVLYEELGSGGRRDLKPCRVLEVGFMIIL